MQIIHAVMGCQQNRFFLTVVRLKFLEHYISLFKIRLDSILKPLELNKKKAGKAICLPALL